MGERPATRHEYTERPCACCGQRTAREGEGGIYSLTCARLKGGDCCARALEEEAQREAARKEQARRRCSCCGGRLSRRETAGHSSRGRSWTIEWHCFECDLVDSTEHECEAPSRGEPPWMGNGAEPRPGTL